LRADGYSAYKSAFGSSPQITLHARHYFYKAREDYAGKKLAHQALKQIGRLYEGSADGACVSSSTCRCARKHLYRFLRRTGKALDSGRELYAAALPSLCQYIGDGCIEIDNNAVERAIRPLALGRKRYLFAGSHQNAAFYSLLSTRLQLKINPIHWFTDGLKRWPTHPPDEIAELLSHR